MIHTDVFEKFNGIFISAIHDIEHWFPNGFNSIRIRYKKGDEWVFTYFSEGKWSLQMLDSFIEDMKNKKI